MNNDYKSPAFKKLLDSLQQQSWELELLISGFAIFGLFTAFEPLEIGFAQAQSEEQIFGLILYGIALLSSSILLFNLLLHVVLRGLWIGALGLRYVSGDIDFKKLRYSDKFKYYLKNKIISFDRYIATLENYCSVLFAISFLLVFYVLSYALVQGSITLLFYGIASIEFLPKWLEIALIIPLVLFFSIGILLTFIDFITQGLLKRNKWISKIYFPFYWVFSFLTLSFLYRPLVYNFLDNKFGKKIILFLTPIYILILIGTSLTYQNSNFLTSINESSVNYANSENYMDMLLDEKDFPGKVVIPSKIIKKPYLPIFLPFNKKIEDNVFEFNPSLKPKKDKRGWTSQIVEGFNQGQESRQPKKKDSNLTSYRKTINKIYSFKIDTLSYPHEFLISTNSKGQLGFETVLKIDSLQEGVHMLKMTSLKKENDSINNSEITVVPFWYYKE